MCEVFARATGGRAAGAIVAIIGQSNVIIIRRNHAYAATSARMSFGSFGSFVCRITWLRRSR